MNAMNNGKEFPIAAILSVTTRHGIPAEGYAHFFDGVIDVLNFMTGESLYSHAAIRAAEDAKDPNHYSFHIAAIESKWGVKTLTVYPMPPDDHEVIDPYQEAINLGYKGEIIEFDASLKDDIPPYGTLPSEN